MRFFLMLLVLLSATGASADVCEEVTSRSASRILCARTETEYTLTYQDWLARQLTLSSGYYDDLISALCAERQVVREIWSPPFRPTQLRLIQCQ